MFEFVYLELGFWSLVFLLCRRIVKPAGRLRLICCALPFPSCFIRVYPCSSVVTYSGAFLCGLRVSVVKPGPRTQLGRLIFDPPPPNRKRIALAVASIILAPLYVFSAAVPELTLPQAHEAALHNHPLIRVGELKALVAHEAVRQARAGFYPNLSANVVAVGTLDDNTRLAANGGLNNPSIFDRNAEGLMVTQLITDFGRTANLVGSAKLRAEAAANNAQATREQILLAVDGAFFAALQAQAVTHVAEQTVTNRQLFLEQVSSLATNKLRSELDVNFARVNVEEARLLLSKAQNDAEAALTQLSTLMGLREPKPFQLVEQSIPAALNTNVADSVQEALRSRPDLLSLRNQHDADIRYARSERAARYPVISAMGSAGVVPIHDEQLPDSYAAAGLVMSLPLFAGGYYSAREQAARLQAAADEELVRDFENNVIRDVRLAWLNANNAAERYRISGQILDASRTSFELARARYQNGLSSIVEFNQAELTLVSAELTYANTRYEYLLRRSALNFQTGTLR
jgi:outer membrane protein